MVQAWKMLVLAGLAAPAVAADGHAPHAVTTSVPFQRQVVERGQGVYRGAPVDFHIVAGWAVVEGDIILGRAEALAGADDVAKAFTSNNPSTLWPKGASGAYEVPYTVEADPSGRVPAVVAAFNATFAGFLQLVGRTSQPDYVAFALNLPPGSPACLSNVGRIGGKQTITGPAACSTGALLHEVGHAIGLLHEQQRGDRDQYVDTMFGNLTKVDRTSFALPTFNRQVTGPYDYGSIMHYSPFAFSAHGQATMVTIPQGIEIGQRNGYSAADIDTVHRLYGDAPATVTVTSNPSGLVLAVDGQAVTTPGTFNWPLGSVHTIDVPQASQQQGAVPYVFGRWNVDVAADGAALRTITVAPGQGGAATPVRAPAVTVYTANFVRLYSLAETVGGDTAAAKAAVSAFVVPAPQPYPGLPGTYFRANQPFTLVAQVNPGFAFGGWFYNDLQAESIGSATTAWNVYPSVAATASALVVQAYGKSGPLLLIRGQGNNGVVDGFEITVDGSARTTPYSSVYTVFAGTGPHQVGATATQLDGAATLRYTFTDWDGSPGNPVGVTPPAGTQPSQQMIANFNAQYLVTAKPRSACAGAVTQTPVSADGFHAFGEQLTLTAVPTPGWIFAGWKDDLAALPARQTVTVGGEILATPQFNLVGTPLTVSGTSRRFAVAGEPAFQATIYGTGFTNATVVFVNGVLRPPTLQDANRLQVAIVPGDFANAGELRLTAQNNVGVGCAVFDTTSIPVRAAGYTMPATLDVVEFYNAGLDHYFVSANPDEIAKLDNGTFKGWARTGKTFKAFPADSVALAGDLTHAVCRYYGNPSAGLDSHFYSGAKDECDDVKRKFPDAWVFESADVFQAIFPDRITGECPNGASPVYRLFNQRADVNHRYTTDTALRSQMIGKGYVPEGYGPQGVALCSPA